MLTPLGRIFFLTTGSLSLAAGVIGIFLPVAPTVPFVLLAAFCFSKSSPRLHRWLREHRLFGPMIVDWEDGHVIRPKAKWLATAMLALMLGYSLFFRAIPSVVRVVMGVVAVGVTAFIWSCPSAPKASSTDENAEKVAG